MEILDILKTTGFSGKEAAVYMALLEQGTASVQAVANKALVKRPTAYLVLEDLHKKGLVSVVPRVKKILYRVESPEKILSDYQRKGELLKRFMPELLAMQNTKGEKPQVLLHEGKEAVRRLYEQFLLAKEVDIFCTIKDVLEVYPDLVFRLNEKTVKKEIRLRELLTRSPEDIAFAKKMTHSEYYEHRFAAPGTGFLTDNILYDNNVVFYSYEPHIFAVQISSKVIYQSIRTLFNLAWAAAEAYEKVVPKSNIAM